MLLSENFKEVRKFLTALMPQFHISFDLFLLKLQKSEFTIISKLVHTIDYQ